MPDFERTFQFTRDKFLNSKFQEKIKHLEKIYAELPETTCQHQGNCCLSSFHTSVEYHYLINYIDRNISVEIKRAVVDRLLNFEDRAIYHGTKLVGYHCLFRNMETKKCDIYPARPLICRIYGLLPNTCKSVVFSEGKKLTPNVVKVEDTPDSPDDGICERRPRVKP